MFWFAVSYKKRRVRSQRVCDWSTSVAVVYHDRKKGKESFIARSSVEIQERLRIERNASIVWFGVVQERSCSNGRTKLGKPQLHTFCLLKDGAGRSYVFKKTKESMRLECPICDQAWIDHRGGTKRHQYRL